MVPLLAALAPSVWRWWLQERQPALLMQRQRQRVVALQALARFLTVPGPQLQGVGPLLLLVVVHWAGLRLRLKAWWRGPVVEVAPLQVQLAWPLQFRQLGVHLVPTIGQQVLAGPQPAVVAT